MPSFQVSAKPFGPSLLGTAGSESEKPLQKAIGRPTAGAFPEFPGAAVDLNPCSDGRRGFPAGAGCLCLCDPACAILPVLGVLAPEEPIGS